MHWSESRHIGLNPGTPLQVSSNGKGFRLGFLIRDRDDRVWGLSARHVFDDMEFDTISDKNGTRIAKYHERDQVDKIDSISPHLGRFQIRLRHLQPENLSFAGVWPRTAIDPERSLGMRVWSTDDEFSPGGEVIEVDSVVRVKFADAEKAQIIKGLMVVHFADDAFLEPGFAGTPMVTETGEALGIAFAGVRTQNGAKILLCPISQFLRQSGCHLWVPPGAHWSDIDRKLERFIGVVQRNPGPNLGPPPRLRNRDRSSP